MEVTSSTEIIQVHATLDATAEAGAWGRLREARVNLRPFIRPTIPQTDCSLSSLETTPKRAYAKKLVLLRFWATARRDSSLYRSHRIVHAEIFADDRFDFTR